MSLKEGNNSSEYILTNREKTQEVRRRPVQDKKPEGSPIKTSDSKKNRFAFQADVRIMGMTSQSEVTKFIQEERGDLASSGHVSDKLRAMASNGNLPQSDGTTDALRKILRRE
ncbi:MAG TPA: hypothetical protein PKA38_04425 [Candidatus Levybacteria bacterium]|nr:hypothetical protein [Candidatus Levybacteria bacterium]